MREIKFNAFISYKHAELDNKIAASIVRDLERYHLPAKIRRETGKKKIDRIFRDKDELPITSDLNDTITQALANSDYLIVICSTNTKKSTWVEREIDTFLKNHSMNNILTVLADGEPYDVIPKRLLSDKKKVTDENGREVIIDVPYEPLSCDYRLPAKKAKAEELPRLVAAIVGCAYDELINRQRQYRLHRMMAIFAGAFTLSVGFGAYMLYSNALINKNYTESLRNQSRYLANESEKQLSNGNRIEAMQLALSALPGEQNSKRPVTAEALKALTDASMAYVTLRGSNVEAAWNYTMAGNILDYVLSDDKTILAAVDNSGVACAWNTENHKQIFEDNDNTDFAKKVIIAKDNTIVVIKNNSAAAYDSENGELLWSVSGDLNFSSNAGVFTTDDGKIIAVGTLGTAEILSLKDGSILQSIDIPLEENQRIYRCDLSPDNNRIVFSSYKSDDIGNINMVGEFDISQNNLKVTTLPDGIIMQIAYKAGNIYAAWTKDDSKGSIRLLDYHFMTDEVTDIYCLETGSLREKWKDTHTCSDTSIQADFLELTNGDVLYYKGNIFKEWDSETGLIKSEYNVNDAIVYAAQSGDSSALFITSHGDSVVPIMLGGVQGLDKTHYFGDDLTKAIGGHGIYTLSYNSNEIIYYNASVCDEDWTVLEGENVFSSDGISYYLTDEALLAFFPEGEGTGMYKYDPNDKTYVGKVCISDSLSQYELEILGIRDNVLYLSAFTDRTFEILKVNLDTDEVQTEVISEDYYTSIGTCALAGDKLIYPDRNESGDFEIKVKNISDGTMEASYPCMRVDEIVSFPGQGYLYLQGEGKYTLDLNKKELIPVNVSNLDNDGGKACYSDDGEKMAVAAGNGIVITKTNGDVITEISCHNLIPYGLYYLNDKVEGEILLTLYNDGSLYRYDWITGEIVGKSALSLNSLSDKTADIDYDNDASTMYISLEHNMSVIDTKSWIETAFIGGCIGHHKPTDTFFSWGYKESSDASEIGYYKHYTPEDLIQKAEGILQGAVMSEDKKMIYGIE